MSASRAGLIAVLLAAVVVSTQRAARLEVSASYAGTWTSLSDLPWAEASTGWLGVANQHRPRLDFSFAGSPLRLAGREYPRGIGTYPFSEISYRLDGAYSQLAATVGLDDVTPTGADTVRFLVFADGVLRYDSEPMRADDPPREVAVGLNGAQTLRLVVVDERKGERPLYADWAEARLLRTLVGTPPFDPEWDAQVRADLAERAAARETEHRRLDERAAALLDQLELLLDAAGPDGDLVEGGPRGADAPDGLRAGDRAPVSAAAAAPARPAGPCNSAVTNEARCVESGLPGRAEPSFSNGVRVALDPAAGWLVTGGEALVVALGVEGEARGQLVVLDRRRRRLAVDGAVPAVTIGDRTHWLADAELRGYAVAPVRLDGFGAGREVTAEYRLPNGAAMAVRLTLFAGQPYFLYEIVAGAAPGEPARFHFLDPRRGRAVIGEGAEYVTDFSRLRHAAVPDDGLTRRESVGPAKPLFLWSAPADRGLLLAAVDEAPGPTAFSARRAPGRVGAEVGLSTGPRRGGVTAREVASPRLYVELPPSVDLRRSHANWKSAMAVLYPPAPVPDWARHQWISWYAFNVAIDEATLREQVDYIAANLADLGPWHILVDAGWFVAEGRPGAEWRSVDRAKFPSGLRALVDYAHAKGVRVVGYVSTPYLDSRQRAGDWLGLRKIVEEHRDWLTELGRDGLRESYAFDFRKPPVRGYWRAVIHDLLVEYDMDGIKVDGLGNAEGAQLAPDQVDDFGRVDAVADQALDIYRFFHEEITALKPDAWIQAGWLTPTVANPHSHAFWYGDDYPAFSNPYPFPGLREKVDYAAIQHRLLGQRSNMGNVYDGPNGSTINRWWLGAGLALGTQVALSFDLRAFTPEGLADYRALLAHAHPFAGQTRFGPGLYPDYFATARGGTTYLGVINRRAEPAAVAVRFADLGLDPAAVYWAYDVEGERFLRANALLTADMAPESFRLYVLRQGPGVLWSTSSFAMRPLPRGMEVTIGGPAAVPGRLAVAVPEAPADVSLDGAPLADWRYDAETRVLHLGYAHTGERRTVAVAYP